MTNLDLRKTIIPKSDQLNFDDVQSANIIAKVIKVRAGTRDQPVFVDLEGFDGRPYKPSLSMRRVLIAGWGDHGADWVGRTLELKGDPSVKFGGVAVGGIKIASMSDIDCAFEIMLTTSRGRRSSYRVDELSSDSIKVKRFINTASAMTAEQLQTSIDWVRKNIKQSNLTAQAEQAYNSELVKFVSSSELQNN